MKTRTWRFSIILSLFVLPVLITSCLADMLNKEFDLSPAVTLSYYSDLGSVPKKKKIAPGTALTAEDLTPISVDSNEFTGWYLDKNLENIAREGYIIKQDLSLYAKWKTPTRNPSIVTIAFFDIDDSVRFIVQSEYTNFFSTYEESLSYIPEVEGYAHISFYDDYKLADTYDFNGTTVKNVNVIEKRYYKTNISSASMENLRFLPKSDDFVYNIEITDSNPGSFPYENNLLPPMTLNYENCTGLTSIPANAFAYDEWLKEIKLPSSITSIGQNAFAYCSGLTSVDLSTATSLSQIGNSAFANCTALTDVSLPHYSSMSEINDSCFSNCSSLKVMKLPDGIHEIFTFGFSCCSSLESIYLPSSITKIHIYSFQQCHELRHVYFAGTTAANVNKEDPIITSVEWHYGINW